MTYEVLYNTKIYSPPIQGAMLGGESEYVDVVSLDDDSNSNNSFKSNDMQQQQRPSVIVMGPLC